MNESIVVYRSQFERDFQEWIYDHPGFYIVLISIVLVAFAVSYWPKRRK